MTVAAVSDAGPLIHLAEIDSLDLLTTFDTLLVPAAVSRELAVGGLPEELSDISYELVDVDADRPDIDPELGPGERAGVCPSAASISSHRHAFLSTASTNGYGDEADPRE